jgi:hypothetical protein
MAHKNWLAIALPAVIVGLGLMSSDNPRPFHSPEELAAFYRLSLAPNGHGVLSVDSAILFPLAAQCGTCHSSDPTLFALRAADGTDVNMYDDWRSSMMANATKDPFWRAKVSQEVLVNPAHAADLEDKCTSCHAPAGHFQAKIHDGLSHYTFQQAITDSLGLDGVTCQACHAQAPGDLGSLHSGNVHFDPNDIRVAYGPYPLAFAPTMLITLGITPKFGEHINDAGLCASCHTLITKTVDTQGAYTGNTFVEQATYHEWLNSRYDKEHDNVSCQSCHFPRIPEPVVISKMPTFLTGQKPYGIHEMAGGNVTMLKLMKENRAVLGIDALPEHFDSTIAATLRMLQQKTLDIHLSPVLTSGDTAYFDLTLLNKSGHKFPSGYPSRRAWVEFDVVNSAGVTVFHSGKMSPDGSLPDEDASGEPHHQVINREDQVQIYELTPGDVNGMFTNVLERGHIALKDNRLAPQGFTTTDPAYDTTQIVGQALTDPDFNYLPNGTEGSGTDILHFHVPINGYTGTFQVRARVWYQSLPPRWMVPLFAWSSPMIDTFKAMYDAAEQSPVLVSEALLNNVPVSPVSTSIPDYASDIHVFPSLSSDGWVNIDIPSGVVIHAVKVWDAKGRVVINQPLDRILLPAAKGGYWIAVRTNKGRKTVKVVRI